MIHKFPSRRTMMVAMTGLIPLLSGRSSEAQTISQDKFADKKKNAEKKSKTSGCESGDINQGSPEQYRRAWHNDDTISIQETLDKHSFIQLSPCRLYYANELVIPDKKIVIQMNGSRICASRKCSAVITSFNYEHNVKKPQKQIVLLGPGTIDGNRLADNGLILQAWGSQIGGGVPVEVCNTLDDAVLYTALTRGGQVLEGATIVNSDFNLHIHDNGGHGFRVQDPLRHLATDGILRGRFYRNANSAIFLDCSAGWDISVQTYSNRSGIFLSIAGRGLRLHNCYIDDGKPSDDGRKHGFALKVEDFDDTGMMSMIGNFFLRGDVEIKCKSHSSGSLHQYGNCYGMGSTLRALTNNIVINPA